MASSKIKLPLLNTTRNLEYTKYITKIPEYRRITDTEFIYLPCATQYSLVVLFEDPLELFSIIYGITDLRKNVLLHIKKNRKYYQEVSKTYLALKKIDLVIGTMYRNYHRPALIIIFIFPDLLPKILGTSSQEHACPTRTYACLAKHYSKELLPSSEMPPASNVVRAVQEADTFSESDQELIAELFDSLETPHDQLATASGLIGRLARTIKPNQLMLVLKASIRPLIQLRTAARADIEAATGRPTELPEKQAERIEMLILPDPNTPQLRKEKINSPTRLLAATYTFKIVNTFGERTTQRGLQE